MDEIQITILTCTYNRSEKISILFESLKRQSNKRFIWVIIDDGSEDDTQKSVSGWMKTEIGFPIEYYWKTNGGKHTAINYSLDKINTQWTFIVDSDDYLTDDCIEYAYKWIEDITPKIKMYMGIGGQRGYSEKELIGRYPKKKKYKEYIDINQIDRKKYGVIGDKSEIYKTELLREFPFPVFEGENFIPESASIYRIARKGYLTRYYNKINYICHYLPDGLTKSEGLSKKNFNGFTYNEKIKFEVCHFPENIMALVRFCENARRKKLSDAEIIDVIGCTKMQFKISLFLMHIRKIIKWIIRK